MQLWHIVYRWQNHADLSSFMAQLHVKICTLFSSCNPRELPLCVSLSFLPSGKIYGYGQCFCWSTFVPGLCRCLPHTKIKLQDSHTSHEKPRIVGFLMRGSTLETLYQRCLIYTAEVLSMFKVIGILEISI